MQEKGMLSIIIPVYNTEPYLRRCIDSVINQTYGNLEIILVDDGSTDGSGNICDAYAETDARVRVIHQENGGQANARCAGMEAAGGKYLGFVDSDDWIACEMYEKLLRDAEHYDLVTSGLQRHDTTGRITSILTDSLPAGAYETSRELASFFDNLVICKYGENAVFAEGLLHSACSKLFRTKIVREIYREANVSVKNGEDWLFCMLYALKCNAVKVTHESYYHYMRRAGSASDRMNPYCLSENNALYLTVSKALQGHWMEKQIRLQFQRWFMCRVAEMIPKFLQFDPSAVFPQYICPYFNALRGKKIVIFGAGRVGRDYCRELDTADFYVVLWVDNYHCGEKYYGKKIDPPDKLADAAYA